MQPKLKIDDAPAKHGNSVGKWENKDNVVTAVVPTACNVGATVTAVFQATDPSPWDLFWSEFAKLKLFQIYFLENSENLLHFLILEDFVDIFHTFFNFFF